MHPPDSGKQNGGVGAITPEHRRNEKIDTDQAQALSSARVARRADKRHVVGQLPIVRSATAYPAGYGLVTVVVVLDQECECGDWHNHRVKAPAPALLPRKARCGTRYELMLHPPRIRRARRAA